MIDFAAGCGVGIGVGVITAWLFIVRPLMNTLIAMRYDGFRAEPRAMKAISSNPPRPIRED